MSGTATPPKPVAPVKPVVPAAKEPAIVTSITSTGDPTGLHTLEIVQNDVKEVVEVQGNAGRVIAAHARLRDVIDMIRSVGQPPGTAAAKLAAAVATPPEQAAHIANLEQRLKAAEAQIVALGGKPAETFVPPAPLPPVPRLTVATPTPQVVGNAFRLAGTYQGAAPGGIDMQVDMGPFGQLLAPAPTIADGVWDAMVTMTDDGPHTLTVRETGTVIPSATTGSFVVAAAPPGPIVPGSVL